MSYGIGQAKSADCEADTDCFTGAERRAEARLLTVFRIAKLAHSGEESMCRLRNISTHGFRADAAPAPAVGEKVLLELREGEGLAATVRWAWGETFGAAFDDAQDVEALLARGLLQGGHQPRPVRISTEGFATVRLDSSRHSATVTEASQQGMRIAIDAALPVGKDVVLTVDGLGTLTATVRWCKEGCAGLRLRDPLAYDALAHWLWMSRSRRDGGLRRAG